MGEAINQHRLCVMYESALPAWESHMLSLDRQSDSDIFVSVEYQVSVE